MKTIILLIMASIASINFNTEIDYQFESININNACMSMFMGPGDCEYKLGEVCDFHSEWLINYVEKSDDDDDDGCTGTDVCVD